MVLPCLDRASGIKIDLIFSTSEFERQALTRSIGVTMEGSDVAIVSVEDLIIMKIVAGRGRDLDDARTIVAKHPKLDVEHIRTWLRWFEKLLDRSLVRDFDLLRSGHASR
jgi:predicted nucleotidyltransferase